MGWNNFCFRNIAQDRGGSQRFLPAQFDYVEINEEFQEDALALGYIDTNNDQISLKSFWKSLMQPEKVRDRPFLVSTISSILLERNSKPLHQISVGS